MHLNHPKTAPYPSPWKNCLPRNWSLVPKRLGTAAIQHEEYGQEHCNNFVWKQMVTTLIVVIIS